MSDIEKILLTSTLTIFAGLLIHALSQVFLKVFIEPLSEFRRNRSEALSLLSFYSNMLNSRLQGDDRDDKYYIDRYYRAQDEIRMSMAKLKASYYSIAPLWMAIQLNLVPKKMLFKEVTSNLLSLSFLGAYKTNSENSKCNVELAKNTTALLDAEW